MAVLSVLLARNLTKVFLLVAGVLGVWRNKRIEEALNKFEKNNTLISNFPAYFLWYNQTLKKYFPT